MKTYRGICVGGPAAGRNYVSESASLEVFESTPTPIVNVRPNVAKMRIAAEPFRYIHTELYGHEFWMPMNWTINSLLLELIVAYTKTNTA